MRKSETVLTRETSVGSFIKYVKLMFYVAMTTASRGGPSDDCSLSAVKAQVTSAQLYTDAKRVLGRRSGGVDGLAYKACDINTQLLLLLLHLPLLLLLSL